MQIDNSLYPYGCLNGSLRIAHDSILAYRTEILSTCMLPKFNLPIKELYSLCYQ